MQRIERYGVIALVFLLVTIVAVSLWGERKKTDGWFSFLDRDSKASQVEELLADASVEGATAEPAAQRDLVHPSVPLSEGTWSGAPTQAFGGPEQAPLTYHDQPIDPTGSPVVMEPIPDGPLAVNKPVEDAPVTPPTTQPSVARDYTIRSGDTLSQIAQRELGTKDRWRELVELNPGLDPARLHVGTKIRLTGAAAKTSQPARVETPKPAVAQAQGAKAQPPAAGGRSYTVRSGDTLSRIAQSQLGSATRWRELVALNPGLDPARLHVGAKLRLPGEAPRETRVARSETVASAPAAVEKGSKVR